jgi:arsenate reductase (glutaredoxin)
MITIYHNPRCATSRAGLKYLEERTGGFEIVQYLKEGISPGKVSELIQKTGLSPLDLVRKQEDFYKKELKGKDIPDDAWPRILAENPRLIQRPIVEKDDQAILAQPPDEIEKIL